MDIYKKFFKDRNFYYTPVGDDISKDMKAVKDFNINAVLIAYHPDKQKDFIRKGIHYKENDVMVIADSGGFYLANKPKEAFKFSPLDVLRAQKKASHIGIILDLPHLNNTFKESINYTRKSVKIYAKYKGDYPVLLVAHNSDIKSLNIWVDTVFSEDFNKFHGVAVTGVRLPTAEFQSINSFWVHIINFAYFLRFKHIKHIHLLAASSLKIFALLPFLSQFVDYITLDSSTPSRYRAMKVFQDFILNVQYNIGRNKKQDEQFIYPCNCPACQRRNKDLKKNWLEFHTLWWYENYIRSWWNLFLNNKEYYVKVLNNYFEGFGFKYIQAVLDFVSEAKELPENYDFNLLFRKYLPYLK